MNMFGEIASMAKGRPMRDSALDLLAYCAQHPDEPQSTWSLARNVGIPRTTLQLLISEEEQGCRRRGGPPTISIVAWEYGFDYRLYRAWHNNYGQGRILDVERKGTMERFVT